MKSKTIYLAGPIADMSDELCVRWREHVKEIWPGACLDPMRRDYRNRQSDPGIEEVIVEQDLQDIHAADGVLVNFHRVTTGTCMEIPYAFLEKKPIVVVYSAYGSPSPWLRYHATRIIYATPGHSPLHALRVACSTMATILERNQE